MGEVREINRMKATGMVRRIDDLGRIVLPKELRTTLDIDNHEPVEIFVEGESVILRKWQISCIFCNSIKEVGEYKGKPICAKCMEELKNL